MPAGIQRPEVHEVDFGDNPHRNSLEVLVRSLTGDALADHTVHATWLGNETAPRLDTVKR